MRGGASREAPPREVEYIIYFLFPPPISFIFYFFLFILPPLLSFPSLGYALSSPLFFIHVYADPEKEFSGLMNVEKGCAGSFKSTR